MTTDLKGIAYAMTCTAFPFDTGDFCNNLLAYSGIYCHFFIPLLDFDRPAATGDRILPTGKAWLDVQDSACFFKQAKPNQV